MRVDSLIPLVEEVFQDMVARDPLEKCLIESLTMIDLDFEHPSTDQEISETLLTTDENKESVVIEEVMKTSMGLYLRSFPRIFVKWANMS